MWKYWATWLDTIKSIKKIIRDENFHMNTSWVDWEPKFVIRKEEWMNAKCNRSLWNAEWHRDCRYEDPSLAQRKS